MASCERGDSAWSVPPDGRVIPVTLWLLVEDTEDTITWEVQCDWRDAAAVMGARLFDCYEDALNYARTCDTQQEPT